MIECVTYLINYVPKQKWKMLRPMSLPVNLIITKLLAVTYFHKKIELINLPSGKSDALAVRRDRANFCNVSMIITSYHKTENYETEYTFRSTISTSHQVFHI